MLSGLRAIKGPCLTMIGGAALFFFIAASALADWLPSPSDPLPRPSWWNDAGYEMVNAGKWDITRQRLEDKYAEPAIKPVWSFAMAPLPEGGLARATVDFSKVNWSAVTDNAFEHDILRVDRFVKAKNPNVVYLRARIDLKEPADYRIFFAAQDFAILCLNGRELVRRPFDGDTHAESVSVAASFPKGQSTVLVALARRPGACTFAFRIGRTNGHYRRIGFLAKLQEIYPDDKGHVVAAQKEIADTIRDYLDDPVHAEVEYRRLYLMAAGNVEMSSYALRQLAALYTASGRADWAAEALRERLRMLKAAAPGARDSWAGAAVDCARSSAAIGDLSGAVSVLLDARGPSPRQAVDIELAAILRAYSLDDRALRAYESLDQASLEEARAKEVAEAVAGIKAVKANSAFLELNHTAAAKLDTVRNLASAGENDRAAAAIIAALDSDGRPLLPTPDGGVGTPLVVSELLAGNSALASAYAAAAAGAPLRTGTAMPEVLARRPGSAAARDALKAFAADAASRGEYALAALAAERLLKDYAPTSDVAALAVSSLAASGDTVRAREVLASLPKGIAPANLTAMLDAFGDPASKAPYKPAATAAGSALEVLWSADVNVSGISMDAGRMVQPYSTLPRAGGAVADGKLFVFDGARLTAYDVEKGDKLFETSAPLPAGMRLLTRDDMTVRPNSPTRSVGFYPPASVAIGGGKVFFSMRAVNEITGDKAVSFIVAADAANGRILWSTPGAALGKAACFVSAPTWGHDRVHTIARGGLDTPLIYLACLNASDGSPAYVETLDSCYGIFPTSTVWGGPLVDSNAFIAAPTVCGDTVFAAPNSGAVFAVDALTGMVKTAWSYPRATLTSPEDGLLALLAQRPLRPMVAASGMIAAAPNDTAELLLAKNGKMISAEIPGAREVIGAVSSVIVHISDDVRATDAATGKTVWQATRPGDAFLPGGVVGDGIAVVPSTESLSFYATADGKKIASYPWPDGVPRGNLILAGDEIIAFGESDVVAMKVGAPAKALGRGKPTQGMAGTALVNAAIRLSAGGAPRLNAAPAGPAAYLISAEGAPSVVFERDGRTFVFTAGQPLALWDISGPAKLLWTQAAPIAASRALYADGRIVIADDWTLAALSISDGAQLWREDAVKFAPVQLSGTSAITHLVAAGNRLMYARGAHIAVVDASSGATMRTMATPGQVMAVASGAFADGAGYFAVATADWSRPNVVRILAAEDASLKAIFAAGAKHDQNLALEARADGRLIVCCPGLPLTVCADAATGAVVWQHTGQTRMDRLAQLDGSDNLVAWSGTLGDKRNYVVLDAANGKAVRSGPCQGFVCLSSDSFFVLGGDSVLSKFVMGAEKPVFVAACKLDQAWLRPMAVREREKAITVLLGDADGGAGHGMSLLEIEAMSGKTKGQWELPLASETGARTELADAGDGAFALAGAEGVLRATWTDAATDCRVACIRSCGPDGRSVAIGGTAGEALQERNAVVDGDLADWADAKWSDVRVAQGVAARVAVAQGGGRLLVAVRTFGGESAGAARDAYQPLRFTIGAAKEAAKSGFAADMDALIDERGVTVLVRGAEVVSARRANAAGGFDCELAVPWHSVKRLADEGMSAPMSVALAGLSADREHWWVWPDNAVYVPREFRAVAREAKGK